MRLKISFVDVKKLFNFIDKRGSGEIGYDEFTMLLEERWRGIDPVLELKENLKTRKPNPMQIQRPTEIKLKTGTGMTEEDAFSYIEGFAKNKLKVPVREDQKISDKITDVNRNQDLLNKSRRIP